ncbi:6904_t:CDS:1, partial [Racocetra persica]
ANISNVCHVRYTKKGSHRMDAVAMSNGHGINKLKNHVITLRYELMFRKIQQPLIDDFSKDFLTASEHIFFVP